jgi:hypothetical protein
MFVTPVQRMSKRQVVELAQDRPKMDAIVDQVSTFLADVLCIRDDMTPRKPLVQLCNEEIRYLPTRAKMEEMKLFEEAYAFVSSAHWLATDVRHAAMHSCGENLDMAAFAAREIYYLHDEISSSGVSPTRIPVGGFFFKLAREVLKHAEHWLDELDRALCSAAGIERSGAATLNMQPVRARLATAIARRAALETADVSDDELSARALDALMSEEVRRNSAHAQGEVQADLRALEMLLCLALRPRGAEARAAVTQEASMADLCRLVDSPPSELACHPLCAEARLEQLGRALVPGMDTEVRVALVSFWAANHGSSAATAATAALAELRQWSPSSKTAFPSLIRDAPGKKQASVAVPKMRFLHTSRRSIVQGSAWLRRGLDERGVRVVRLVQAVWELSAYGVFHPGVVAAEPAAAVALEEIITSRFACATIDKERRTSNHGVRLGRFLGMLHDPEGDHAGRVQRACCALSRFSCDELEAVFSTSGQILPVVCGALAARTRSKMTCAVDTQYCSFAADALALALPLVEMRRKSLGIRASETTHPLVDLLMTAEKARGWDPIEGSLRLEVDDLSAAHKQLRVALDAMHEAGVLVKRKGGAANGSKKKIVYEFHSMTLRKLLDSWVEEAMDVE